MSVLISHVSLQVVPSGKASMGAIHRVRALVVVAVEPTAIVFCLVSDEIFLKGESYITGPASCFEASIWLAVVFLVSASHC